jgi:hypothetical protein
VRQSMVLGVERTDEFVADERLLTDGPPASPAVPQVREGDRVIGVGTHQRRLVQAG